MSISKGKCWYSNNCLHFLKRAVPLIIGKDMELTRLLIDPCCLPSLQEIVVPAATAKIMALHD
jgi:hypothetical protein